ncbi:MAG TPA: tetratricopeptide repeat protein, partial [Sedimentisphaerales bacterium]|nr:tetratricopeptide repeat protein [Sedimentisphaerales bacterium]
GVYDGKNIKLYIDGKLDSSEAASEKQISRLKNKLTIGENLLNGKSGQDAKYSRSWHGNISQVAIFDNALTLVEVCWLYNSDPIISPKYYCLNGIISRGDIDLLRDTPQELFDEFIECKKLFEERKYSEAIKALDELILKNKASQQSFVVRASLLESQIYIQQDDIENATKTIEVLQKTYPELDSPEVTFSLAYCYAKQGNSSQAETLLRQIIDNHPQSDYALRAQLCLSRLMAK